MEGILGAGKSSSGCGHGSAVKSLKSFECRAGIYSMKVELTHFQTVSDFFDDFCGQQSV